MSMGMVWKVGVAFAIMLVVGACAPTAPEVELVPERGEEPAAPAPVQKPAEPLRVPTLTETRIESYERAAAGTLRALAAAQSTFVARCIVDQDGDGAGEYGFFQEMSGALPPRGRNEPLAGWPVFDARFVHDDERGVVTRAGYCFILYLPTASGVATHEGAGSVPRADDGNANVQETRWIAYAWPAEFGVTGRRAFVISQQGFEFNQVTQPHVCENADGRYSGSENAPEPGAALAPNEGREQNLDSGFPGPGQRGRDGEKWVRLEQ